MHKIPILLQDRPEVEVCLLFGSAVENRLRPDSDLDIAVCGERALTNSYLADLQLLLSEKLGREVDLVDMNRVDGLILAQAITKGRKIINNKPELLAYHIKRMLFYSADMYPNYRLMQKAKVMRFAYGH